MKLKRVFFFVLPLVLLLQVSTYATNNLGTLDHWHAYHGGNVFSEIARWQLAPKTYSETLSGFSSITFISHVNTARNAWRNAGISIDSVASESNSNFRIYGGNISDLRDIESGLPSSFDGWTKWSHSIFEGVWAYNNTNKYGQIQLSIEIFIPYDSNENSQFYDKVLTHEFGHGLGWRGHSNNDDDLMYHSTYSNTNSLTTRDKEHLVQVY